MVRALAAVMVLLAPGVAAGGVPDVQIRTPLVIRVQTHTDVPRHELQASLDQADRAFRAAGIQTEWRSAGAAGPGEFTLLLLSREMADRKCAADGLDASVLGSAASAIGRAWIFVERITTVARGQGLPVSDILGQVITHELGHLLLPANAEEIGIMREQVQRTGAAAVRFSGVHAQRMRAMLRGRMRPGEVLARTRR